MAKSREKTKREFAERLNNSLRAIGIPERGRMVATARLFSVSNSAAKKWLDGDAMPDTFRMQELALKLKVRAEWLFTGIKNEADIAIGQRIRRLRKEKVWDLPYAAKRAEIPLLRYAMIEKGEAHAFGDELQSIADAYETDINSLLGITAPVAVPHEHEGKDYSSLCPRQRRILELFDQLSPEDGDRLLAIGDSLAQRIEKDAARK